jgi:hypothetical protein
MSYGIRKDGVFFQAKKALKRLWSAMVCRPPG